MDTTAKVALGTVAIFAGVVIAGSILNAMDTDRDPVRSCTLGHMRFTSTVNKHFTSYSHKLRPELLRCKGLQDLS